MKQPRTRIYWKSVWVYYLIACAWSWPFFWRRDVLRIPETNLLVHWGLMWGPGIGALACFVLFRSAHRRIITLQGNSLIRSILFYAAPFLLMALFRAHNLNGYNLRPLLAMFPMFVSVLGEELGWRGFLQDALRPLSSSTRYVLIGVLWAFWHFTTHTLHQGKPLRFLIVQLIFYSSTILLSFVIGFAVEHSRSAIVAVSIHNYVDVFIANPSLYIPLLLALPVWVLLLMTWPLQQVVNEKALEPEAITS